MDGRHGGFRSIAGARVEALAGAGAAALAVLPNRMAMGAAVAAVCAAAGVWWMLARPNRWVMVLFGCLLLLPPLPVGVGEGSLHVAPMVMAVGVLVGLTQRWGGWRGEPAVFWLLAFLLAAAASTALAGVYSGAEVQAGSAARLLLLAASAYVFLFTCAGPGRSSWDGRRMARLLLVMMTASALFACVDFYYQFPAPAGYGPQFVWLDSGVFRRAQGLFYEASTLGNVCVCFLVMIAVEWMRPGAERVMARPALAVSALVIAVAMIFSYSRGSLVCLLVALVVLAGLKRMHVGRALVAAGVFVLAAGLIAGLLLPSLFDTYVTRLAASFQYFQASPDGVLSGRLTTWARLLALLEREPWHAVLGIGYKTLPYSTFAGEPVIADNTYLSLLVETGVVGLTAFVLLNVALLRAAWRARETFFGEWMFAFWCGELVQMLSGDLITYWRVLPIYFWALAMAARADRGSA